MAYIKRLDEIPVHEIPLMNVIAGRRDHGVASIRGTPVSSLGKLDTLFVRRA